MTDFGLMEEVRKHPGVATGALAVLAGIGIATLLLRQRTGPRRYELLMDRLDPRGWLDTDELRDRMEEFSDHAQDEAESLRHKAADRIQDISGRAKDFGLDLGARARDFAGTARERFDDWRSDYTPSRRRRRHYSRKARRAAEDAAEFARDHAREGAALATVALIAAAIGAIALEHKRVSE